MFLFQNKCVVCVFMERLNRFGRTWLYLASVHNTFKQVNCSLHMNMSKNMSFLL